MKRSSHIRWNTRVLTSFSHDRTTIKNIRSACDRHLLGDSRWSIRTERGTDPVLLASFDLLVPAPIGEKKFNILFWSTLSMNSRETLGNRWMETKSFPLILALRSVKMRNKPWLNGGIPQDAGSHILRCLMNDEVISSTTLTGTREDIGSLLASCYCDCSVHVPLPQSLRVGYFVCPSVTDGGGDTHAHPSFIDFCV